MSAEDSVPIVGPASATPGGGTSNDSDGATSGKKEPRLRMANIKLLTILLIIILTIDSDLFINNVLSGFGAKAVRCRTPTSWGKVLIAIFIVLFYILAIYLSEHGYL